MHAGADLNAARLEADGEGRRMRSSASWAELDAPALESHQTVWDAEAVVVIGECEQRGTRDPNLIAKLQEQA
jgi:hypothetical protein